MWTWFHRLASPPAFYRFADALRPWLAWATAALVVYGLIGGLWLAPPDYQQGEGYRIIFVHVPAAWMSLFVYTAMAAAALIGIVWRIKLAEGFVAEAAPVGASFTALALVTGMLWGKPMWGAYWVWDARLTSELILLFLYVGVIAVNQAFPDPRAAARAAGLLAIVGVVNVPVVHYSVQWWNSLHQGSTVFRINGPAISPAMLWPLLAMAVGFTTFFALVMMTRLQNALLTRERGAAWIRELSEAGRV